MIIPANQEGIVRAAKCLAQGGLVAFPTETVYGLGANAFNAEAAARIFSVKQRDLSDPLIVHFHTLEQIPSLVELDANQQSLLEKMKVFWPGPLSLVLPKNKNIPDVISAGLKTVAIRIPQHTVALDLLRACGFPIAAPSANPFGKISPTTAAHVEKTLGSSIDIILDGGACPLGLESTVLSLVDSIPTLLRPGALTLESLLQKLDRVTLREAALGSHSELNSPGLLDSHYSPKTKLSFVQDLAEYPENTSYLAFADRGPLDPRFKKTIYLSKDSNLQEIAAGLYSGLHALDELGFDLIVVDQCPAEGIGLAIMDRLTKAVHKS